MRLDQARHELACASCGAPLHDLKMIPVKQAPRPAVTHQKVVSHPKPVARKTPKKSKPIKRRKSWFGERFKDLAEDLFDVVEDIFD